MFGIVVTNNYYSAEINLGAAVPGAGSNINFGDIPQLRNKLIYGIECITGDVLTTSATGKTLITTATGIVVVFQVKNFDKVFYYPITNLVTISRYGIIPAFTPTMIDFQKSYIRITNVTGLSANESVVFGFHYDNPTK